MAKQVKLNASTRATAGTGASKALRAQGLIPANIYAAGETNLNLQVVGRELEKLLSHAVGENILVDLEIEDNGSKSNRLALIQEVQHEPISGKVVHVDFHAVKMDEKLHANVPLEPVGEPNGVRNFGGLLEQSLRALAIECLPKDLPEIIRVDVSALNIGDAIHVRDIVLPEGVAAIEDGELTVFLVASPSVQEEEAAPVEGAPTQPEVIREKKEEPAAAEKK